MPFQKPNISYRPLEVETLNIDASSGTQLSSTLSQSQEDETIANKLMDHLALIQDYNNRIDAINYLIDNARTLSGNLIYTTDDTNLMASITALGGTGNSVDLKLFEKSVDLVIQGYKEMALISLTGVAK